MAWHASRDPSIQQRWRERVRRFEASNLTARAFCAGEAFGAESLRRWRRWCGQNPPQLPALVEVKLTAPVPPPPPRDHMVVELGGGRRLTLEPGFDADAVARLVNILDRP
jgi:hypothetical protein